MILTVCSVRLAASHLKEQKRYLLHPDLTPAVLHKYQIPKYSVLVSSSVGCGPICGGETWFREDYGIVHEEEEVDEEEGVGLLQFLCQCSLHS